MDVWQTATITLGATSLLLLWLVRTLVGRLRRLRSLRQSQATRHGQTLEQFAPLLGAWPWDAKDFRFLGTPVDGVQFTSEGIIFVEIKTGRSTLSARQREVRAMVEAGKVRWAEVRL